MGGGQRGQKQMLPSSPPSTKLRCRNTEQVHFRDGREAKQAVAACSVRRDSFVKCNQRSFRYDSRLQLDTQPKLAVALTYKTIRAAVTGKGQI